MRYCHGISILQNTNTEYQWLKLTKDFFNFSNDISTCLAYIAPKLSDFSKKQDTSILELIEHDIINKYGNLGDIVITGDMNARTGVHNDFIQGDSVSHILLDNIGYDVDVAAGERHSNDITIDVRGKELLEMCVANKLRIVNGRIFGDSMCKFTCNNCVGSSVLDYFIVSEMLLEDILYAGIRFYTNIRLSL